MKSKRINRSRAKEFLPVASMPKFNSAKCHNENQCYLHPACDLGKSCFKMEEGWELLGWTTPPRKGSAPDAIVYRKNIPKDNGWGGGCHGHFEPGIYWTHGRASEMKFEM